MQLSLDFIVDAAPGLIGVRKRLLDAFGPFRDDRRLEPMDQLVRSMICGRTQDTASDAAYARLKLRFRPWSELLDVPVAEVASLLGAVTFAGDKAARLNAAFATIKARTGVVSLDALAEMPVEKAYTWLRGLEGVGAFAAAATLNSSTLRRRVFAVDTHGLRVLQRLGLIGPSVSAEAAGGILLRIAPAAWTAEDFYELHWLLKRLGQIRCGHAVPRCGGCPLVGACAGKIAQRPAASVLRTPREGLWRSTYPASGSLAF